MGTVSHNVEVKLVDVPSLGYSAEDKPNPRGELCVRGASVFKEYYKGSLSRCGVVLILIGMRRASLDGRSQG